MRSLNDFIERNSGRGFSTKANAEKKAQQVLQDDDRTASVVFVERSDGRWFPVAINPEPALIGYYAQRGLIVWS